LHRRRCAKLRCLSPFRVHITRLAHLEALKRLGADTFRTELSGGVTERLCSLRSLSCNARGFAKLRRLRKVAVAIKR
jgi:hypothetical protein